MYVGFQSFNQLSPLGKLLCVLLVILPQAVLFLHPNTLLPSSPKEIAFPTIVEFIFIVAFFVFLLLRRYQFRLSPPIIWGCFLLWLVASLLTLNTAANAGQAAHKYIQYLVHFLFAVALLNYMRKEKGEALSLYIALLLSLYLMLFVFTGLTAFLSQQPGFNWTGHLPGFSNVRHLDYILAVMLSATAMLPYAARNIMFGRWKTIFFVTLTLLWLLLCWTGGRGSILAALGAVAICLFLMRKDRITRQVAIVFFGSMILGALMSLALPRPDNNYGLIRFATTITTEGGLNSLSSNRVAIWLEALEHWWAAPWFGVGAGQLKFIAQETSGIFVQPHNVVIQALLAWGIVGGLPFLAALGGSLWSGFRHVNQRMADNPAAVAGLAIMLTIAANAMIDGTLYHPVPTFLFLIGMGLALTPSPKRA
ncbi:O-antigen ligase family protein [Emcibacter nanhaiensis]|uniref:O-antigen ligase family protein n=1 Tax=Emcibacter nanhaiensis TaxID=1505037 RepID=A0A501PHK7_9PROT|nr:O-antigen ligase family protein [Emcibacter nanhaiensis]TPD59424.1 O-antigen ligase family protein [Emcibacter nanhaiensis]